MIHILTLLNLLAAISLLACPLVPTHHQILLTQLNTHLAFLAQLCLGFCLIFVTEHMQSPKIVCSLSISCSITAFPWVLCFSYPTHFDLVSKHSVNHHPFADDNQLYKFSTLDAIHQSIETLQNCTTDVKSWMTANKLQQNDNKIEAMIILSNRISIHSPFLSVIQRH